MANDPLNIYIDTERRTFQQEGGLVLGVTTEVTFTGNYGANPALMIFTYDKSTKELTPIAVTEKSGGKRLLKLTSQTAKDAFAGHEKLGEKLPFVGWVIDGDYVSVHTEGGVSTISIADEAEALAEGMILIKWSPIIVDEGQVFLMVPRGLSAYELAVKYGYKGTEEEWIGEFAKAEEERNRQFAAQTSGLVNQVRTAISNIPADLPAWNTINEAASTIGGITPVIDNLSLRASQASVNPTDAVADLDIADGSGNVILRLVGGGLKTKEFDTEKVNTKIAEQDQKIETLESKGETVSTFFDSGDDFDITDEKGNVILRFKEGGLITKNFDSRKVNKSLFDINKRNIEAYKDVVSSASGIEIVVPSFKNNYSISFNGEVGSVGELKILTKINDQLVQGEVILTASKIRVKQNGVERYDEYDHTLNLSASIFVDISVTRSHYATLKIADSSGHLFNQEIQWYSAGDKVFVQATSGEYRNCRLSYGGRAFSCDVWIFGDSYLNHWTPYMDEMGYHNYAALGYGGQGSYDAYPKFQAALQFAKPKLVVWMMGMNDSETNGENSWWRRGFDGVRSECAANSIEFVGATVCTTNVRRNIYKNAAVRASGCRYLDVAKLFGCEEDGSTGFAGLMNADGVHPSVIGDRLLARFISQEIPQIVNP